MLSFIQNNESTERTYVQAKVKKLEMFVKKVPKEGNKAVIAEMNGETKALNKEIIKLNIPVKIAFIITFPP